MSLSSSEIVSPREWQGHVRVKNFARSPQLLSWNSGKMFKNCSGVNERQERPIPATMRQRLRRMLCSHGLLGRGSAAFTSLFRIGSSNPAMRFWLARAPIVRQSIARWHNRYRFPRGELSQKSFYLRQFRATKDALPRTTSALSHPFFMFPFRATLTRLLPLREC
jgi:hypothetical protein